MRGDPVKQARADQRTSTSFPSFLSDSRALEIVEVSVKKGVETKGFIVLLRITEESKRHGN